MNSLNENAVIGLLIALSIGPDLANPGLSLALRLTSVALLAAIGGRRIAADLMAQIQRVISGPRVCAPTKAKLP